MTTPVQTTALAEGTGVEPELSLRMRQARAKSHLYQAPQLVTHILSLVVPTIGNAPGPRVSGSRDTPLPLNARAMEDANDLYGQLVNWSTLYARKLRIAPPASVLAWARTDRDCEGFPSWSTTADSIELLRDVTRWLIAVGDRIAKLPAATDYFDSVKDLVSPLISRYPTAPRAIRYATRPCPVCTKRTIIVDFDARTPLGYEDGLNYEVVTTVVACTHCGHVVPSKAVPRYVEEDA